MFRDLYIFILCHAYVPFSGHEQSMCYTSAATTIDCNIFNLYHPKFQIKPKSVKC